MPDLTTTNTVHGIKFNRSGSCNRCPKEKEAPCCLGCPHFKNIEGVNTCLIYDKREQICEECSIGRPIKRTHINCINFPDHPWLGVIKNGKCIYKFETINSTELSKLSDLNTKWQ